MTPTTRLRLTRRLPRLETCILLVSVYLTVASVVFFWRNPTCNEMGFFRHFPSVVMFEKLPQYQPDRP